MKTALASAASPALPRTLPNAASLAAFRAWLEGLPAREVVVRYLPDQVGDGQSARGVLSRIRTQLVSAARHMRQHEIATILSQQREATAEQAKAISLAIEILRNLPMREPSIDDPVEDWVSARSARLLNDAGISTLGQLTVRVPRRREWWKAIDGLGRTGALAIEEVFQAHPRLTERARALIDQSATSAVVPWERLVIPPHLDGSNGTLRAPLAGASLGADTDYAAVSAWLNLHETTATRNAYRKEVERFLLWCILEREKSLSSATVEDALAYRAFLRRPTPVLRWIGPSRSRSSHEWRPFNRALSPRSAAYALTVLGVMFRWLMQQRYLLANPFAGVRVKGVDRAQAMDVSRALDDGEWRYIREVAEALEWSYGWEKGAAYRMRFILDFGYATGLRSEELVRATLGNVEVDDNGNHWLHVQGKGSKKGRVALPPLARSALDRYLVQRGLATTRSQWASKTPILGRVDTDDAAGLSASRLRALVKRFFALTATLIADRNPIVAEKLNRASPHWMRHTHATHALQQGVEMTSVRDQLRHASIATTSLYADSDDRRRASQINKTFAERR